MHRLFITALACLISVSVFGQGWEQTLDGGSYDEGRSVQQTTDGGYIVTGTTQSGALRYVYLVKTDGNGNEQWSQTFGYSSDPSNFGQSNGFSVQQTTDGGYIVTGFTQAFGAGDRDIYLIKTDGNGNEQWSKTFGGTGYDEGWSVQQTTDEGYIITGSLNGDNESSDVYLIKTDENGNELWSQTLGGESYDVGRSVHQTTDGGYIITGSTSSFGAGSLDVYLIKTDENGNEQWSQTFGGESGEGGNSVQLTTDGGYIVTGSSSSFGAGERDVYLIKTDGNGNEQWSQTFGGVDIEIGHSVQQTIDGGYIITGNLGTSNSADFEYHYVYQIKTDENGNEQWSQTFSSEDSFFADSDGYSVQQTTDGGYIIAGRTSSFSSSGQDVYLIKTDSEGILSSSFTIPTPSPRKLDKVVDALGREVNHTTNQILFYIYDDGSVEKKFIVE